MRPRTAIAKIRKENKEKDLVESTVRKASPKKVWVEMEAKIKHFQTIVETAKAPEVSKVVEYQISSKKVEGKQETQQKQEE